MQEPDKNIDFGEFLNNSTNKDALERNKKGASSDFIKSTFDEVLKFQTNLSGNSNKTITPENSEDNSSDYNNDSEQYSSAPSGMSSPEKPRGNTQFTLNVNGNGENDTPQNLSDDSNGSNDENVQNEIAAEQNDENFKGVINVEEMNEQQEIDQENKRKLNFQITRNQIIFEQNNELKKENSIKGNVWACILSSLGFAIAFGAIGVLCTFELLPGVGEILMVVALVVVAYAFGGISEINAIKIAEKNMENIKEQDKEGVREQKSPVKNMCAAIFSGLGGAGVLGGFLAVFFLIFAEEILPLFAVALISFAFCACAMALFNVCVYNAKKAHDIKKMNSENAKKEQEQNKENEKEKSENEEEKVEDKSKEGNENEVNQNQNQETAQQQPIIPSSSQTNVANNVIPPVEPNDPNKVKDD